jgi:steroid 5-alpha reductase family enzyme
MLHRSGTFRIVFFMKITGKTIVYFFTAIIVGSMGIILAYPVASTDPLKIVGIISLLNIAMAFLFSISTNDYSWTDRLWSTVPVLFAWIYASATDFATNSTLAAVLVTLWGLRLTFNFARRGGYTGAEDYRWPILRERIGNEVLWQLFNILFIAAYQQFLFVCFTFPLYYMTRSPQHGITTELLIGSGIMLVFLLFETVSDQQQYNFQQAKYDLLPRKDHMEEDYRRGFRTSGLFSRSRHPNYLGELGFWWGAYFFSAASIGKPINSSIAGPILLTLLFIGSVWFTESITSGKYPDYQEYRKKTWPIFPKPW